MALQVKPHPKSLGYSPAMTHPAALVLQLGFADPAAMLRLPLRPAPALRVALGARLAAHGGVVKDHPQGLASFHLLAHGNAVVEALQMAITLLAQGTQRLAEDLAPVALRAVLVGIASDNEVTRAAALARCACILPASRDHSLLLSRDLYENLTPALRDYARLATPPSLVDAQPELKDLFELDWQAAAFHPAAAAEAPAAPAVGATDEHLLQEARLALSHGDTELQLTPTDCPLTLGRDKSCGLRLDGDVASRVHARIEFEAGQFYFVDDSRNGSYLLTPAGEDIFVHRERLALMGRGVISPGASLVKQTGELVHYRCLAELEHDSAAV